MNRFARQSRVLAGRENLVGIENVDQVMWNAPPFFGRHFGSTDVEVAVDLQRIAIEDFAVELLRDFECQIALSRAGRAHHRNQREVRHVFSGRASWGGSVVRGHGVVVRALASNPRYTI